LRNRPHPLDRFWVDPSRLLTEAGLTPDEWQKKLLTSSAPRTLLLASRQSGKSTVAAALALKAALLEPPSTILILSLNLRQAGEFFRDKVLTLWKALGCPALKKSPTQLSLELSNGSRIISLPSSEAGIRGFSNIRLLVVDEASRVSDDLYRAVRPMLAVSHGRIICLTTPFGKRGFFYEEFNGSSDWQKVRITATQCPRIGAAFLAKERKSLGERWYRQEYLCSFEDTVGAVFDSVEVSATMVEGIPLFGG
jgi:hypothetical protein